MKIYELFEQTIAPQPPGQGQPTQPTEAPPNTSNTPKTTQPTGTPTLGNQTPTTTGQPQATPPNPNTPQVGQTMAA